MRLEATLGATLLALGVALLSACNGGPDHGWYGTTAPRHPLDELWVNNFTEPESIDPGLSSDQGGTTLMSNLFEGLLQPDPATMAPIPGVAERWEISPDKRTYTFHLRAEAKWSDGHPVTAQDFAWSWMRVLDPKTAAKHSTDLYILEGGQAFNEGKAPASAVGVTALDDHTLTVKLTGPIPYFLSALTTEHTWDPVPRWVLEGLAAKGLDPDLWTRPEHIVSNGAFVLKEWHFRHYLLFEKNPLYWDAARTRLTRVKVLEVESSNTALMLYKAGELDFSGENVALPPEYLPYLRTRKDWHLATWNATYWYWLNVKAEGVSDRRVRHALNRAIDKKAIVEDVTRQSQLPATTFVPAGLPGYHPPPGEGYDPEAARKLLAEAGHAGGAGLPPITIVYNTSEAHRAIAEAVQAMWKKELGIDARLENREWATFQRDLVAKDFQVARLGWVGDYPDPFTFLNVFLSVNGDNHSNWASPEYDRLVEEGNAEVDPEKRMAALSRAEAMLVEELPAIPLYWYTRAFLTKPYVHGVTENSLDRHPWKAIWLAP